MAWQDEMTIILRALINDLASVTYTDDTLQTVLVVGGRLVADKLTFLQPYKCDVVSVDIAPDPTAVSSRDEWFIDLACLRAACIISHGSAMVSANQAISVRDGSSAVDLRGIVQGNIQLLQKGWCAVYEKTEFEYLSAQSSGVVGAAIMTPFRTLVYGSRGQLLTVPGRERQPVY